jgi:hypothetical protein
MVFRSLLRIEEESSSMSAKQGYAFDLLRFGPWLLLVVLAGCGHREDRLPVSGAVTLDGQPFGGGGAISFQPVDAKQGSSAGATLGANGAYSIPAAKGLRPGKYRVVVQVWRETNRTFIHPDTGKPVKITAPIQFKENASLEATVVAGHANRFDFHLPSVR